jgi:hypothetical protein
MPICQICKQSFAQIKFLSKDISVCGICVKALNEHNGQADASYQTFRDWLKTGMIRKNQSRLHDESIQVWERERAQRILENLDDEVDKALPHWTIKRLADPTKREKPYKIVRAHKRGLLFRNLSDQRPTYRSNWMEVAREIRLRDQYQCRVCSATDVELHVHHIIFLSNHGTNRKSNLITLCRSCHQDQHKHEFDILETHGESGNVNPEIPADLAGDTTEILIADGNVSLETAQVDLGKKVAPANESQTSPDSYGIRMSLSKDLPCTESRTTKSTTRKSHPLEIIACVALVMAFLLVLSSLRR